MHKRDQQTILIKTLAEGYTITAACKRAGVSRMFYNRHYKTDLEFRKKVDRAYILGKQVNDDRVLSVYMKQINEARDWRPIKYYLEHNVAPYMQKNTPSPPAGILSRVEAATSEIEKYTQFIRWSAMTLEERAWYGIEIREQFCKAYQVPNVGMLAIWAQRKDFEPRVKALREEWVFSKTSEILGGVYTAARNGDHKSQKLWLEHVYHMTEKKEENVPGQVVIAPGDIRFLIESLPEPLKTKHYSRLRELLDDSAAAAQAGTLKDYQDAGILDKNGEIVNDLEGKERDIHNKLDIYDI